MFKKIRTLEKLAKTVTSPITHAKNVIKSTFAKPTKSPKIGGTKKSDKNKRSCWNKKES